MSMGGLAPFRLVAPVLTFKNEDVQTGGGHYFYQDIWALRHLARIKPKMHYDVGSRLDGFTGQATSICAVTYVDIRPPTFELPEFSFIKGDILNLPFANESIQTLSCLHTIEHIGLGRYGDPINPEGYDRTLLELQRVVSPGGYLLLSMPVGKERTEFNAQRILDPMNCILRLKDMDLIEFSVVDNAGIFKVNVLPSTYVEAIFSCGLYLFRKKTLPIS